jgi:SprT protein
MPKKEAPLLYLDNYLPAGATEKLLEYLHRYKVHLTITRSRKSILGDYRHATPGNNHRISVNGNLNSFAFLITLIHEIGHLVTFQKYGNNVNAHGKEWKHEYRLVLEDFLKLKLFPSDLKQTLIKSLNNLPASSCSDLSLTRVLKKYDGPGATILVEEIEVGEFFKTSDGKIFIRGKQVRKRIECAETKTGKLYLFSPVYEVESVGKKE